MKEEKFILLETQAKVYFANKENEQKFKDVKLKVYSEDKEFILVYSENDISKIINMYNFMEDQDYQTNQSLEDEIYDNFLIEFHIEEIKFKNWSFVVQKIDELKDISVKYDINGLKFYTLFNKKNSIKDGAEVIFGFNSNRNDAFITVATGKIAAKEDNNND